MASSATNWKPATTTHYQSLPPFAASHRLSRRQLRSGFSVGREGVAYIAPRPLSRLDRASRYLLPAIGATGAGYAALRAIRNRRKATRKTSHGKQSQSESKQSILNPHRLAALNLGDYIESQRQQGDTLIARVKARVKSR